MLMSDLRTYFPPQRLRGTKGLTMFENGPDNAITDMTVRQLSRREKVWRKEGDGSARGCLKKSWGDNVEKDAASPEQRSENRWRTGRWHVSDGGVGSCRGWRPKTGCKFRTKEKETRWASTPLFAAVRQRLDGDGDGGAGRKTMNEAKCRRNLIRKSHDSKAEPLPDVWKQILIIYESIRIRPPLQSPHQTTHLFIFSAVKTMAKKADVRTSMAAAAAAAARERNSSFFEHNIWLLGQFAALLSNYKTFTLCFLLSGGGGQSARWSCTNEELLLDLSALNFSSTKSALFEILATWEGSVTPFLNHHKYINSSSSSIQLLSLWAIPHLAYEAPKLP